MFFYNKNMRFNLKKYITERYLTEKIQSDIVINKLLNDKGGLFKYYKNPNSPSYKKVLDIFNNIEKILYKICNNLNMKCDNKTEDGYYIFKNDESNMSDKELKIYHQQYMDLIQQYIKSITKIFDKPDPAILKAVINGIYNYNQEFRNNSVDLFNITDDNFKIYYYKDIKGNKILQKELNNELQYKVAFFISENDKIEAASKSGKILLLPLDSEYLKNNSSYNFKYYSSDPYNIFNQYTDKDNIILSKFYIQLKTTNELLEIPLITSTTRLPYRYKIFQGEKKSAIENIHDLLNINSHNFCGKYIINMNLKVGKVNSKASNIQKITNWGKSLNDYIIVYTASSTYKKDGNTKSTINQGKNNAVSYVDTTMGYNELKHSNYVTRRKEQREDYLDTYKRTYKWIKTLLGQYKPYAGGKQNSVWEYGKKLNDDDYYTLYSDDHYCNKLVRENIGRYKVLLAQTKSLKNVNIYVEQMKSIMADINTFVVNGKNLITKIKSTYKEDKDKFKTLMLLYGTYNKTLNIIITRYSSIQQHIENFNNEYNIKNIFSKKYSWQTDYDLQDNINTSINKIKSKINLLEQYLPQIEELNDKIYDILNQ